MTLQGSCPSEIRPGSQDEHAGPQDEVVVVTDSAASLPSDAVAALGVHVVPMTLEVGGSVYPDGALDPAAVVQRASHLRVTTSAPSPGAYLEALAAAGSRPVVVTTVARRTSASYESALAAAGYRRAGRVEVVDTQTAAGGQGLVVMAAARAARSGNSLEEVATAARAVAARVRLLAFLEQLDSLARSGRVPGVAARAGRSLGARAVFELTRGRVRSRRPARTLDGAVGRIMAACAAGSQAGARLRAAVLEAQAPCGAEALLAAVHELAPDADVYRAPFSSVMVAHTGPGLAGLAWWWEPSPQSPSPPAS